MLEQAELFWRWGAFSLLTSARKAVVLLAAGGTAIEVRALPGDRRIGVGTTEFELDGPVELVETRVAADLRPKEGLRSRVRAC